MSKPEFLCLPDLLGYQASVLNIEHGFRVTLQSWFEYGPGFNCEDKDWFENEASSSCSSRHIMGHGRYCILQIFFTIFFC